MGRDLGAPEHRTVGGGVSAGRCAPAAWAWAMKSKGLAWRERAEMLGSGSGGSARSEGAGGRGNACRKTGPPRLQPWNPELGWVRMSRLACTAAKQRDAGRIRKAFFPFLSACGNYQRTG